MAKLKELGQSAVEEARRRENVLVIVSRLEIGPADRKWIEGIRRDHDPQRAIIDAHFTHVFPFASSPIAEVISHAAAIAASTDVVSFQLSKVAAVRDSTAPRTLVFLLPTEGELEIRRLHDRLYSGFLAPMLRADIPFVPHVTVAAFDRNDEAERMANDLQPFNISGKLTAMDLLAFDGTTVTELHRFQFR
jgi:2'-5' RNA ligase